MHMNTATFHCKRTHPAYQKLCFNQSKLIIEKMSNDDETIEVLTLLDDLIATYNTCTSDDIHIKAKAILRGIKVVLLP